MKITLALAIVATFAALATALPQLPVPIEPLIQPLSGGIPVKDSADTESESKVKREADEDDGNSEASPTDELTKAAEGLPETPVTGLSDGAPADIVPDEVVDSPISGLTGFSGGKNGKKKGKKSKKEGKKKIDNDRKRRSPDVPIGVLPFGDKLTGQKKQQKRDIPIVGGLLNGLLGKGKE